MTTILKLGGSVVTAKDRRETVDDSSIARAASAIAEAGPERLVVVHGGGSFGHPIATNRAVNSEVGTDDAADVRAIHETMGRLLRHVTDALSDGGVPAVPVRPFSAGYRTAGGTVELYTEAVSTMVNEGFVPVLHGDVFVTDGGGATIVSGDELVVALGEAMAADRIGLCSTVPGVLDENGDVVSSIERYEDVDRILGESEATDVTGGMAGKVRALLDADVSASIFGLDDLGDFLAGEGVGTRVDRGP
ncbi:MAG: isopentenyl phosphate kinase [Halanaeroarchaeum sp.]